MRKTNAGQTPKVITYHTPTFIESATARPRVEAMVFAGEVETTAGIDPYIKSAVSRMPRWRSHIRRD